MPANAVIQVREGTAAAWTAANPYLAAGEIGWETDTGQYKVGTGIAQWVSLPYGGINGPAQTSVLESFGDGSDGNITIASGTTTLVRDMYYNNLTINGTGILNVAGYRVFVLGTFDISAAQVGAVISNATSGATATTQTGGVTGTGITAATVGGSGNGTAGTTGTAAAGTTAAAPAAQTPANGGAGGASGSGGAGNTGGANAGGPSGAGGTVALALPLQRWENNLLRGISLLVAGAGGRGGSSGGG